VARKCLGTSSPINFAESSTKGREAFFPCLHEVVTIELIIELTIELTIELAIELADPTSAHPPSLA